MADPMRARVSLLGLIAALALLQGSAPIAQSRLTTRADPTPLIATQAVYDLALKAPRCGPTSACDSGPMLLRGRDSISGGPEPNQPNTINNSCSDGIGGSFHVDKSIDRVTVTSLDGTPLGPGKTARIDVTVWVFSPFIDRLELYYTANVRIV